MLKFSYEVSPELVYTNATAEITSIKKDSDRKIVEFGVEIRNEEGDVVKTFSVVVGNYVIGKEKEEVDGEEVEKDIWDMSFDETFKSVSSEETLIKKAYELLKERTFEGIDFSVAKDA